MKDYYRINEFILQEWEEEFKSNYKDEKNAPDFCKDGLMNTGDFADNNQCQFDEYWPKGWVRLASGQESKLWAETPLRILYLTKDLNGGEDGSGWDVRYESLYKAGIDDEVLRKDSLFKLLAYTLYGLSQSDINVPISYENIENTPQEEILKIVNATPFARINVKKEVGLSTVGDEALVNSMEKYKKYLLRQITSLDPDLIVCCGNRDNKNVILEFLNKYYYSFKPTSEGSPIHYDKGLGVVAIDSYHFAAHIKHENMYNDVVMRFFEFLKNNDLNFLIR